MDLAFLAPRADHDPSLHAPRVVIGEQAAGCRAFIIRVRADHEQPHARLTTAIGDARGLHVPSSLGVPAATGCPATAMAAPTVPHILPLTGNSRQDGLHSRPVARTHHA